MRYLGRSFIQMFTGILELWNRFWFKPIDSFPAALFRISFAAIIFLQYGLRQFNVLEYYSDRGTVPLAEATELLPEIFRPSFFSKFLVRSLIIISGCESR